MMCDPIVRRLATAADELTFDLDLPIDLPCFAGHFPGFPVLAGVVQLDWVMRLAAAHLPCRQSSATDFRIKFKRVLRPGCGLTLTLRHDPVRRRLHFVYRDGEAVATQGQVMLSAP